MQRCARDWYLSSALAESGFRWHSLRRTQYFGVVLENDWRPIVDELHQNADLATRLAPFTSSMPEYTSSLT